MSLALKYFQKRPNAGDQFSRLVAERYFSPDIVACDDRPLAQPNLILLGSILQWCDSRSQVCGAGLISSDSNVASPPAAIHCVRGPLTAHFLQRQGIPAPRMYADPGILAFRFFTERPKPDFKLGVIPHYVDAESPWIELCRQRGVRVIDPRSPLPLYFEDLQRCEVILSSSLHGLIFAHAFGKPALWIELSNRVIGDGFKFFDYYLSLGISPEKVWRQPVSETTDPRGIASRATWIDQSKQIPGLEAALSVAKAALARGGE